MCLTNSPVSLDVVQMWLQLSQMLKFRTASLLPAPRCRVVGRWHAGHAGQDDAIERGS